MPKIGLDRIFMAEITEDAQGHEIYATPEFVSKAVFANIAINETEAGFYADDALEEYHRSFVDGTIELNVKDLPAVIQQKILGVLVDSNGVVVNTGGGSPPPVALGFRSLRSKGGYEYTWLYRVVFGEPGEENATKGETLSFKTPTIRGKIMKRHKPDGLGNKPWRARVKSGEAGVPPQVVTDWYNSVYEPDYTVSPVITLTGQPDPLTTVTEGSISGNLSVSASATGGTLTYQWFSNTINGNSGGTPILGANSATFAIPSDLTVGTYYYYCILKASVRQLATNVAVVQVDS